MENLVRISDILIFDAKTRDKKTEYNISDVILSHNGNITGMIVSGKGLLGIKRYVKAESIECLKKDCVLIKKTEKLQPKRIKNLNYASTALLRKKVVSEDNMFMGMLSDLYIHTDKMQVMAVEVARSFFEDLFTGRTLIPGNIIAYMADCIVISEMQIENSLHNTKGILNAIDGGLG